MREDCEEQTLPRATVCKRAVKSESCLGGHVQDGDEERVLPKSDRVRESCAEQELPRVTVREDCGANTAQSNLVREDSEEASAAKSDCVQDCEKAKAAISGGLREACEGVRKTAKKSKAATSDHVREVCKGVREKTAKKKKADGAKSGRVRECYITAKTPKATVCKETAKAYAARSDRVRGDCGKRMLLDSGRAKRKNSLLAVTDVDEEL